VSGLLVCVVQLALFFVARPQIFALAIVLGAGIVLAAKAA